MPHSGVPPTSSPQPDASPVQTAEPTVPDRILLPPPAVAPPEAPARRTLAFLDYVLAALVLAFAFFAASFPAHNSDLWLHLATGRAFVDGSCHFGVDPFAQGTAGVYWVNSNWLYDVLTYLVFRSAGGIDGMGGAALIFLKAIGVTALTAVLLRLGWCGRGLWAPAIGAAAAVLVLGPWLAPHPMIVSYLVLALTLYFLERPHRSTNHDGAGLVAKPLSLTAYWPLAPLFVLWVNLDSWFLLGPLTVALYLFGGVLQSRFGPGRGAADTIRAGETRVLGFTLIASLTALSEPASPSNPSRPRSDAH